MDVCTLCMYVCYAMLCICKVRLLCVQYLYACVACFECRCVRFVICLMYVCYVCELSTHVVYVCVVAYV